MSFQDIKGRDNIAQIFKKALSSGKVSHAYLFAGPDGVGKTLFASTLAKALNCLEAQADSCDKCASCVKIENKTHPDAIWISVPEKKDSIGIEEIRDLQKKISLRPYEGRTKVFIVQDAHLMTQDSANCLLKTLEEPPKDSVLILISSKPEEMLATVKSRCKQIKFSPLQLQHRVELSIKEGFTKEEAVFLSRLANSGISISADLEGGGLIAYKNEVLAEFDSKGALLDERSFIFNESKERMKFIIALLEGWYRDVLVVKSAGDVSVIINSDRLAELKTTAANISFETIEGILKEIENTYFCIDRNVGPKLAFNALKLKMARKAQ